MGFLIKKENKIKKDMISDTFIFHVRKILKINIISINQWDCLERYLHQQY